MALELNVFVRNHVRAGEQVLAVNGGDDLRLRDGQQIVVAAQIDGPIRESAAAKFGLAQTMPLNHGAHGAVENDQPLLQER